MKFIISPVLLLLAVIMTDDTWPLRSKARANPSVYEQPTPDHSEHQQHRENDASEQVNTDTSSLDVSPQDDSSYSATSTDEYSSDGISGERESQSTSDEIIDSNELVRQHNESSEKTWTANSHKFDKDMRASAIRGMANSCSIKREIPYDETPEAHPMDQSSQHLNPDDLPVQYDARKRYKRICRMISSVKSQHNCGACWAIAVASAFSDRLCIHSKGKITDEMSSAQLLSCTKPGYGCGGGEEDDAWKYIIQNGVVTGGDYKSKKGCQPYPFGPTPKSWWRRIIRSERTPKCSTKSCTITYKAKDLRQFTNEYEIRREIFTNGPVTATMRVYLSYLFYSEGIYRKTWKWDPPMGCHVVRITGWGEEDGIKYWKGVNSWGPEWGEYGTFRIVRGINHCNIEKQVLGAIPVLEGL